MAIAYLLSNEVSKNVKIKSLKLIVIRENEFLIKKYKKIDFSTFQTSDPIGLKIDTGNAIDTFYVPTNLFELDEKFFNLKIKLMYSCEKYSRSWKIEKT